MVSNFNFCHTVFNSVYQMYFHFYRVFVFSLDVLKSFPVILMYVGNNLTGESQVPRVLSICSFLNVTARKLI